MFLTILLRISHTEKLPLKEEQWAQVAGKWYKVLRLVETRQPLPAGKERGRVVAKRGGGEEELIKSLPLRSGSM